VLHTLSEEVCPGLLSMLMPPAKAPKHPGKPSHSRQDEMLCHDGLGYYLPIEEGLFWILYAYIHVDNNQDQLIQLIVQPK
jgi:hypothetical protein